MTTPTNVTQKQIAQQALQQLARLGGMLTKEDDVVFQGTKFILPETSKDLRSAAKVLLQRAEDEETETEFKRSFPYRPWDGARATELAIRDAFGFSISTPIMTFFGPEPPQMVTVPSGVGEEIEVPWGALKLPGLKDTTLFLGATRDRELGQCFHVSVNAPRKYRFHIQGLFQLIAKHLEEDSIYRGKAIDGAEMPNFIDTSAVTPNDVVYTQEVMRQLEANVWSPIRHAAQLEALGQPGKRSVLFEGPYGTGKTLGALLTAQVAVANGWTFLLCRPGKDDLHTTLQTARMYQPSVVFYEDLDTVGSADGTTDEVTRILDSFDGLQTKGLQMLLVLTTNHVDTIHKGMLRPGRLDAVIHIGAMDEPGVERLARRVIGEALVTDVAWHEVFEAMEGFMPAFVREALDRAVRYNVARNDGVLGSINTQDLVLAAQGLRPQLDLMAGARDTVNAPRIEGIIEGIVQETMNGAAVKRGGEDFAVIEVAEPGKVRESA